MGPEDRAKRNSKILQRDDDRLLVEFHTPVISLTGRRRVYRTVEWVTFREPEVINFEGVEGPLAMLRDQFDLQEEGGCTRLTYTSEFGLPGWVIGWALGRLVVRSMLHRTMVEHMAELRVTIEEAGQAQQGVPPNSRAAWRRQPGKIGQPGWVKPAKQRLSSGPSAGLWQNNSAAFMMVEESGAYP